MQQWSLPAQCSELGTERNVTARRTKRSGLRSPLLFPRGGRVSLRFEAVPSIIPSHVLRLHRCKTARASPTRSRHSPGKARLLPSGLGRDGRLPCVPIEKRTGDF
jgi:hypothetical protein